MWVSIAVRCSGLWRPACLCWRREESIGFVVVLDALRSQYYTEWRKRKTERDTGIFASRIGSKGSYIQEEFPLSFLYLHFFGKTSFEDAFVIPAEKKQSENSPVQPPTTSRTSSRRKRVAAQWIPPLLFLVLRADKCIWFHILKRLGVFCIHMRAPKSPFGSL